MRNWSVTRKEFSSYLTAVILTSLAQNVDYITDPLFAGNLVCQEAIAAMNLYSPFMHLSFSFLLLLVQGSMMLAANALGNGDSSSISKHFTVSFTSLFILYVCLITIILGFRYRIVAFLCPEPGMIRDLLYQYLTLVVFEMMVAGLYLTLHYFISIDGHPEISGKSSIILIVIQVTLAYVLSRYTAYGIRSFAAANIISEIIAIAYLLRHYFSKECHFRFVLMKGEYFKYLKLNVGKGLPQIVNTVAFMLAILLINESVQLVSGENGVQAWSLAYVPISAGILIYLAISEVFLALGEVKLGEKDSDGIKYIFKSSTLIMEVSSVAIIILAELFPGTIMKSLGCEDALQIDALRMPFRCSLPLLFAFAAVQLKALGFIVIDKNVTYSILTFIVNIFPSAFVTIFAFFFKESFWWSFLVAIVFELVLFVYIDRKFRREFKSLAEWANPQLNIPVKYDYNSLGKAVQEMTSFVKRIQGVDDDMINRMEHSSEELMYNIIKHVPKQRMGDNFSFRVLRLPESIDFIFKDAGRPYNPIIGFGDKAVDAYAADQKLQLALRLFNHYAANPSYKFCYGLNMTRLSFSLHDSVKFSRPTAVRN